MLKELLPKWGGGECFSRVKVPESLGPLALEFSFVFPDAGEKWVWGEGGAGPASLGWARCRLSGLHRLSPRVKSRPPLQRGRKWDYAEKWNRQGGWKERAEAQECRTWRAVDTEVARTLPPSQA